MKIRLRHTWKVFIVVKFRYGWSGKTSILGGAEKKSLDVCMKLKRMISKADSDKQL